MFQRPSRREDFEVAIICTLPLEYDALFLLFDEIWDEGGHKSGREIGDFNYYTVGRIGKHDVVLALLYRLGKANPASSAASMRSSYGALKLVILAGICGDVPRNGQDNIFLGDVVISSSIIQYDLGRHYPNGFMHKNTNEDYLRKHDKNIGNLLENLGTETSKDKLRERTTHFLKRLREKAAQHQQKYNYPGTDKVKLFDSKYRHMHHKPTTCICSNCHGRKDPVCDEALNSSCDDLGCCEDFLVERSQIEEQGKAHEPAIHIGAVASSATVMKSGEDRDEIAKEEGIIALDKGAAEVWEEMPCIVVKGICEYADCHKDKAWQHFAAATAASASNAIIEQYKQKDRGHGRIVKKRPQSHFLATLKRNQEDFFRRETLLPKLLGGIDWVAFEEDLPRNALQGLGGISKTQVALQAPYLLHNEHPDHRGLWLTAAPGFGFNWPMAVDNTDTIGLLFGGPGLSIFSTARKHGVKLDDILLENNFNITAMIANEILSLTRKGFKKSPTSNTRNTKELLYAPASLLLPIEQASTYMTINQLLVHLMLYELESEAIMSLLGTNFKGRHRYKEMQNRVIRSLHTLVKEFLLDGSLSANHLQLMSILAEKLISRSLSPMSTKIEPKDVIATLNAYVLIPQRKGEALPNIRQLTRLAAQNWLDKEEKLEESAVSAMGRLNELMLFPKHRDKGAWMKLLPHEQAVLELPKHMGFKKRKPGLPGSISRLGRPSLGLMVAQNIWKYHREAVSEYRSKTLKGIHIPAGLRTDLGKLKMVEKMHPQAFELQTKVLSNDPLDILGNMDNFAVMLSAQGKYEDAVMMHRQTAELREKVLGKDHPDTLISMNHLRLALRNLENGVENGIQLLLGHDIRPLTFEADVIKPQTSSTSTIDGTADQGEALISEALAGQPQFRTLCEKALAKTNRERFVEDMIRLLELFHICLEEEAESEVEKAVAQSLRSEKRRQHIGDQLSNRMGHTLATKEDQESDAGDTSLKDVREPDDFPLNSELNTFLSASTAFKQLQMRLTLTFLSADLGYIVQSIPKDHIWLSKEQDVSISNQFKTFIENSTKARWNWWPLSPRKRMLSPEESRIFWKCTCGTKHWEEISPEQREFVEIALKLSDNNPPLPSRCGVRKVSATLRPSFGGIISGEQAASSSQAAQKYTPPNIPESSKNQQAASLVLNLAPSLEQELSTVGQIAQASNLESTVDLEWWILFGVRGAWRTLTPAQIHVNSQTTDGQIFQELKKHYRLHRRKISLWLSVWQLDHCEVVKFHRLDANNIVREHKDLPSGADYHYDPHKSGARNPPIPPDLFQILFYACDSSCPLRRFHDCIHPNRNTLNIARIPKRIKKFEDDEKSPIWGFEPVFSVSFAYALVYHCVILAGPFIFWGVWLRYHPGDLQDASVPLSIVIAALSLFWSGAGILTSRNTE